MTDSMLNYIVIWAVGILAVFSFVMGIEKMVKIVLWNYILGSLCLAAGESLSMLVRFLVQNPEQRFFGITYQWFANFFTNGKTTLILILYAGLLVLIYLKGKIHIRVPDDDTSQKLLYIFLVPITVISIIITLQIALMGLQVLDITKLQWLAEWISGNNYFYKFLSATPVWVFLHGIATIIITSELKISFRSSPQI